MRAGIVYIKVPIDAINYEKTDDDVTFLKESIKMYGLLQPVGIKAKKEITPVAEAVTTAGIPACPSTEK